MRFDLLIRKWVGERHGAVWGLCSPLPELLEMTRERQTGWYEVGEAFGVLGHAYLICHARRGAITK